jgi:hypothetical protein
VRQAMAQMRQKMNGVLLHDKKRRLKRRFFLLTPELIRVSIHAANRDTY